MDVLNIQTWIDEFGKDQLNLDKLQEYLDFIQEAVERYDESRYSEWHHIMPKCVDKEGKYVKYAHLNGAGHFRAHIKLVDCFNNGQYRFKLSCALSLMSESRTSGTAPEDYEKASRLFAESQKGENNPAKRQEVRDKIRKSHQNLTEEQRKRISENHADVSGKNNPFYGKNHTQESIQKMKEHLPDRSGENNSFYGKHHTEETRAKMRRPKSEEHRRKLSESRKGTIYITDVKINRFIRKGDPLPEGFRYGRTVNKRKKVSNEL